MRFAPKDFFKDQTSSIVQMRPWSRYRVAHDAMRGSYSGGHHLLLFVSELSNCKAPVHRPKRPAEGVPQSNVPAMGLVFTLLFPRTTFNSFRSSSS